METTTGYYLVFTLHSQTRQTANIKSCRTDANVSNQRPLPVPLDDLRIPLGADGAWPPCSCVSVKGARPSFSRAL